MDVPLASVDHISDCSTSDEIMRKLPSQAESLILEQKQNVDGQVCIIFEVVDNLFRMQKCLHQTTTELYY